MYRWPINAQMMDPQHHQSPEEHKAKPPRGTTSQPLRRCHQEDGCVPGIQTHSDAAGGNVKCSCQKSDVLAHDLQTLKAALNVQANLYIMSKDIIPHLGLLLTR